METLDAIIASLRGRSDPVAVQWMESSKRQLRDLRIQATKTKPLEDQVQTLTELLERKRSQLEVASATVAKATEHYNRVSEEFAGVNEELAVVKEKHAEEIALNAENVFTMKGGHMMELDKLASLLPLDQADVAKQGLRLLVPLLTAAGMTPAPSTAASAAGASDISSFMQDINSFRQEDGYESAASDVEPATSKHASSSPPIPPFPRVRGRSANRTKPPFEAPTVVVRSRSPLHAPVRRRQRAKSCMPVGFPVDPRLAGAAGAVDMDFQRRQQVGAS